MTAEDRPPSDADRPDEPEEDERLEEDEGLEADSGSGTAAPDASESLPPPSTWAGRRRAEGAGPRDSAEDASTDAGPERDEELDDFDEIERELDEELGEDDGPPQAGSEPDEEPASRTDADPEPELEGEPASDNTVEADTLSLADREEAREAALAGLRARTAEHEAKRQETGEGVPADAADAAGEVSGDDAEALSEDAEPGEGDGDGIDGAEPSDDEPEAGEEAAERPAAGVAVGVGAPGEENGKPPRAKRLWARFLAASFLIVVSMAAATSISLLLYLTDIAKGLDDNDALQGLQDQLELVDGGEPQTILILGSDKRIDTKGDPGRSDTTILLRVDPEKDAIALLSIPRDLKVTIPGVGVGKFNEAYTAGGPELTLEVVKRITGLKINHVVNINFTGFADAVNAIDCVYIDVDRRYYIPEEADISEIDIEAGYQLLCGYKALQYVRFRHYDTDLVRSARQQDFMREARQKLPPETLIRDRNELLDIFIEYTTSDIDDGVTLLELLKTFAAVQAAPVREVHFPADLGDGTSGFVTAGEEAIEQAVAQFLGTEGTPGGRPGGEAEAPNPDEGESRPDGDADKPKPDEDKPEQDFVGPPMDDSSALGQQYANQFSRKRTKGGEPMVRFPIYYPTRIAPGSALINDSRAFVIDGPEKEKYYGYKFVAARPGPGGFDEYYGVSGTDWVDAPILENESEVRTIDGRDYLLFYDGDRLRLVGWKTKDAAYWVNNTLVQSLEEGEMLSIATSMREFGE